MAQTENTYTQSDTTTVLRSFTFPYINQSDIKVELDGVATTAYSHPNLTQIQLNSAPAVGTAIRIFRQTSDEETQATFYSGSAIRARDLNNNFTQNLYVIQENNNEVASAWKTGDPTIISTETWAGNDTKIATTGAIDGRIDAKIDTALTTDVVGGDRITVTDNSPGSGQITIKVTPGSIESSDILNGTIVNDDINASAAIAGSKLQASTSSNAGSMSSSDKAKLDGIEIGATSDQTASEIRSLVSAANDSNVFTDADHTKLNGIDTGAKDDQTAAEIKTLIATSPLDASHLAPNSVGDSEIVTGALDNRYYTEAESDARYFNVSTGDTIKDGDAFPDNDTTIATTAAINDRIIDLVDDVGGFVPIANETSFPNANPDVNNGTGTLVSIKALSSNLTSNGSGVASISNGAGSGKTVHITGLANNTTYAATFGLILETTQYSGGGRGGSATDYEYTFHRQVPKATEVTTVASNVSNVNTVASNISAVNTVNSNISTINVVAANNTNVTNVGTNIANVNTVATNITDVSSFKDLYQISTSAPSTDGGGNSLAAGDMWFDSSSNKTLKVHNGTAFQSISPSQSVLDDIAIVSGEVTFIEDLGSISTALTTGTGNNINTVATGIANINTVAGVNANITTVAGIAANVTTVAGIASNVTAVAGNASNINSAVSNASNINSAVSNASNINSAVSNASNINTVAGSIADVNRYATEYTISNSTPSSPSSGDLWYDGANNVLKFYNSSSFVGITPGLTDVINDSTPELGGHLDCNDKNLTEVGTVSGNNLQMDFGTLT